MNKISCDVAKDLMTLYADEICSDDSRKLLEDHLRECDECRNFLKTISEKDKKSEETELNTIKKMNKTMNICTKLVFFVPFSIYYMVYYTLQRKPAETGLLPVQYVYMIGMPLMMVCLSFAFSENNKIPYKRSRNAAVGSLVTLIWLILTIIAVLTGGIKNGELIRGVCGTAGVLNGLMLIDMVQCEKRRKSFLFQSLPWLCIHLALMMQALTMFMSEADTFRFRIIFGCAALITEFIIINVIAACRNKKKKFGVVM